MDHKVQEFIVVEVSTRVMIGSNGLDDASGLLVDASGFCMSMFRRSMDVHPDRPYSCLMD